MDGAERVKVVRSAALLAARSKAEAEASRRALGSQPFWRWRRRRKLGQRLATAQRREKKALALLAHDDSAHAR
jgi:hypothetical protein